MEDMKHLKWARKNLMEQANVVRGICEVLRLTYDEVYKLEGGEIKEKIIDLLAETMLMAKKMHNRLVYYKTTYNDTTGHGLKNLVLLPGAEERRRMRKERNEKLTNLHQS